MARKRGTLADWIADAALPIMVLDRRQRVRVFNRGASLTTGFAPGDVLGRRCEYAPEAAPGTPEAMLDAFAVSATQYTGTPDSVRITFAAKSLATIERTALLIPLESQESDSQLLIVLSNAEVKSVPTAESLVPPAALRFARQKHSARYSTSRFIAQSPTMVRVSRQIEAASQSTASVWISGQPGTGRTHVAEMIQSAGVSDGGLAVTIDARLMDEKSLSDLLVRFLATSGKAHSIHCESLNEWSPGSQQILASSVAESDARVRLVSSTTSRSPTSLISNLANAASDITIDLPRLRDRQEDIPLLAQHFLEMHTANQGPSNSAKSNDDALLPISIAEAAILQLQRYTWLGDVAELQKTIQQAVANCRQEVVSVSDLPSSFRSGLDADQLVPTEPIRPLEEVLREVEKNQLNAALEATGGEKSSAAKLLGMSRPKLYRRIEELGIADRNDDAST